MNYYEDYSFDEALDLVNSTYPASEENKRIQMAKHLVKIVRQEEEGPERALEMDRYWTKEYGW